MFDVLWNDKELGSKVRAKAKEKFPDITIPEDALDAVDDKWDEIGQPFKVTKVTMNNKELKEEDPGMIRGTELIWRLIDEADDDCGPMLCLQYTRS